jgi:predicted HTH domain antitoxin
MSEIITAQVKNEIAKELREYMEVYGIDRSAAIRKLLERGIRDWKIETAVTNYRDRKVSLMKASEMAGVSVWEFLDELKKRDIPVNISFKAIEKTLGV